MSDLPKWFMEWLIHNLGLGQVVAFGVAAVLLYALYQKLEIARLQRKMEDAKEQRDAVRKALEEQSQASLLPRIRPNDADRRERPTILVVEDELALAALWTRYFPEYHVVIVSDGDEVLPAIRAFRPALLVLDLMLPNKSGGELLRELAARDSRMPIIVQTGYAETKAEVVANLQLGGARFEFVRKPFMLNDIGQLVRLLIAENSATTEADLHASRSANDKSGQ